MSEGNQLLVDACPLLRSLNLKIDTNVDDWELVIQRLSQAIKYIAHFLVVIIKILRQK